MADVNAARNDGWTALMFACCNGNDSCAEKVLKKGADINAKNRDGYTALMIAREQGHTNCDNPSISHSDYMREKMREQMEMVKTQHIVFNPEHHDHSYTQIDDQHGRLEFKSHKRCGEIWHFHFPSKTRTHMTFAVSHNCYGEIWYFEKEINTIRKEFAEDHDLHGVIKYYDDCEQVRQEFASHHKRHGEIIFFKNMIPVRRQYEVCHKNHGRTEHFDADHKHKDGYCCVRVTHTKEFRCCHACKCDWSNVTQHFKGGRLYETEEVGPTGRIDFFSDYSANTIVRREFVIGHLLHGWIHHFKDNRIVQTTFAEDHPQHGETIHFGGKDQDVSSYRREYPKHHSKHDQVDCYQCSDNKVVELCTEFLGAFKGHVFYFKFAKVYTMQEIIRHKIEPTLYKKVLPNDTTEFYEDRVLTSLEVSKHIDTFGLKRIEYPDGITKVYECGQLQRIQYFKGGPWKKWQEVEAEMQQAKEENAKKVEEHRLLQLAKAEEQRMLKIERAEAEHAKMEEDRRLAAEAKAAQEAQNLQELKEACVARKLREEQEEQERSRLLSQKQKEEDLRQKGIRESKSAEKKAAKKANKEAKKEANIAAKMALEKMKNRKLGTLTECGEEDEEVALNVLDTSTSTPATKPLYTLDTLSAELSTLEPKFSTSEATTLSDTISDIAESSIGGSTTCIVCFTGTKSHIAVPCGHQSVCESCTKQLNNCPYCRTHVTMWMQVRIV